MAKLDINWEILMKILYLMGNRLVLDKAETTIVAEMLNKDYDVTVVIIKNCLLKQSLKNNDELEKSISISAIPYRDKNKIAYAIQKLLFHRIMKNVKQFDIVWLVTLVAGIFSKLDGKVIYDCMDNHEALCNDTRKYAKQ